MLSIPQYLLESSFCLGLFYGFYHFFLRKETFFQLNRAYLILAPVLSLGIPLMNIAFQKDAPAESLEALLYPAIQSANNLNDLVWEQMRAPSPVFSLSIADLLMATYLIGGTLMFFSLARGLWNLGKLIRQGKHSKNNEFTLIETQQNFPAASFFGYIFWNQQITDEQRLILEHEKVHIRQWHSLDVLLMEICVIIKWFNPLIYWFRNALKATHEYIADQYVIQQKSTVGDYATLLVNQHHQLPSAPLTNTFYSLTKKRLQMMLQNPSHKINGLKYLAIFPMIIGLMLLFSFNLLEQIPQVGEGIEEMNAVLGDIGERTVFEISQEQKAKKKEELMEFMNEEHLANFTSTESPNMVHFGDNHAYYLSSFDPFYGGAHNNWVTSTEFLGMLQKEIHFTFNDHALFINELELAIPKLNGGEPFRLKTSKDNNFNFSAKELTVLKKSLKDNDMVFLNGYNEADVYSTEFHIKPEKDKGENRVYELLWGEIEIPIQSYSNQNVGILSYELTLQEFLKIIRSPLKLKKNGEGYLPKEVEIIIHDNERDGFLMQNPKKFGQKEYLSFMSWRTATNGNQEKQDEHIFRTTINGDTEMYFQKEEYEQIFKLINNKASVLIRIMDDHLLAASIWVKNPIGDFTPPQHININEKKIYDFQLVTPLEGIAVLKIDTIKSAKISNMYRDKNKYKIIHIPNFQTTERVLDEKENPSQSARPLIYNSVTEVDYLPNYVVEKPRNFRVEWGALIAGPESENLSLKEFHQNALAAPILFHGPQQLDYSKIRLSIIKDKTVFTKSFSKKDFNSKEMGTVLNKIGTETSIYLDKIEITDKGIRKHLQHRFLFKVGNDVIKKISEVNEPYYQLKWGALDLPSIYNKNTNATVAHFMTVEDFVKNLNIPFQLYKNGKLMDGQELNISFFNTENGDWGIQKFNTINENYQYWQAVQLKYPQLKLKNINKQKFHSNEITDIQNFAKEGWIMTIRAKDNYLIYSSISLVHPKSSLLFSKTKEQIKIE